MKIEHVGIAVDDLDSAIQIYEKLLGSSCYKREVVESEDVVTAFMHAGGSKIELLAASSPESIIARHLEKRGEGVHHIAFEVEDIRAEIKRLKGEGFTLVNEVPKPGADNKIVAFVHPKDNCGVLVELCQSV
ncbi:MAG: methylmalonyl-CoA epimerase [Balneolaceae bacterium]